MASQLALDDMTDSYDGQKSDAEPIVADGIPDYITGKLDIKDTPKEQVRQRMARALFHEYGISVEDMESDFPVKVDGKRKKIDIAIFHHDQPHTVENLSRAVICRPEPKVGRNVTRIRDYEQAESDLEELKLVMSAVDSCTWGLWTNGLELFYLEKKKTRFEDRYEPIGDWPMADESLGSRDVISLAQTRRADPEMLRTAFRRCHNFIHGNEGMPKDAAFWQFLYLIFCKMYDETRPKQDRLFFVHPKEQFTTEGQEEIRKRIIQLFTSVKKEYSRIFKGNEEISLSNRALAFMASELSRYEFSRTDVDAKGAAYQEIVGNNLRGDRGQYFTPRGVIRMTVEMLDPKEDERLLDPACGTGGFLVAALAYRLKKFREEDNITAQEENSEQFGQHQQRLREYAEHKVFGCDFDPFLIRASQMNMVMAGDGRGHLYHINSLEFPHGHLPDVARANDEIRFGSIQVVMTNPPFGSDIPITDGHILEQYDLAHNWEKLPDGNFRNTGRRQSSVAPEILFIERCLKWLAPGGRAGIVLPDGILGNPAAEYIRWWIMRNAWVLASIDLPVEVFIVEANVNILTSVLILKKKTTAEIMAESLSGPRDYPIFMAVAEKVGFDRRGNKIYKRHPNGDDIIEMKEETESWISSKGAKESRTLRRPSKTIDDDLPEIVKAYKEFRGKYPEPGP
jgi:type I restriction enzyme M protein